MLNEKMPLIAIIGRSNVGKSTLFNRLVEKNQAIVSPVENTTRDFNFNIINWRGVDVQLVDTAGVIEVRKLKKKTDKKNKEVDEIETKTQKQAYNFINKADLIFFVVDSKSGLLPEDKEMSRFLKKRDYEKKSFLIVNKVDAPKYRTEASEFNKLSLGDPFLISATTGTGLGDLLDESINFFEGKEGKEKKIEENDKEKINLCIIGKPNVGKSSLLNSLLGYERVIVSEKPHTTREPQSTELEYKDHIINIIDTAGISKKGEKGEGLEKYGIIKSTQTLKRADIVLLVIDINETITKQDSRLIEKITDLGKSFIIIANKWDLIEDRDTKKWTRHINMHFPFILWSPILFISAKTGEKTKKIFDLVLEIKKSRHMKVNETALSRFLVKMIKKHKPSKGRGMKHPRIYSLRQSWTNPPEFEIKIGAQEDLHKSYIRFLENRIREHFGFLACPIKISIKKAKKIHGKERN
jgi:GTPase